MKIKSSCILLLCCFMLSCTTNESPKILLLGDSISIGYLPFVKEQLKGKALVDRIPLRENGKPENCQGTTNGVTHIDRWLGDTKWDVIHFNFGLHDLKHVNAVTGKNSDNINDPHQADLGQYRKNLTEIVSRLKETDAQLIFATTTPYPAGTSPFRAVGDVAKYNAVAIEIMEENKIPINDLYSFVKPIMADLQKPKNVHFTDYGSQKLGEQVVNSLGFEE